MEKYWNGIGNIFKIFVYNTRIWISSIIYPYINISCQDCDTHTCTVYMCTKILLSYAVFLGKIINIIDIACVNIKL